MFGVDRDREFYLDAKFADTDLDLMVGGPAEVGPFADARDHQIAIG